MVGWRNQIIYSNEKTDIIMKNIIRLLTLMIISGLTLTGCETKFDDPAGVRDLIKATPVIENLDPSIFLAADKENTYVEFDVTSGSGGQTMDGLIEVSYDGGQQRAELQKFTIPATGVKITLAGVAQALGMAVDDMEGGKYVNIEILTKSADKYYRSSAAVNPLIACDYVAEDYVGTATAQSPGWELSGPVQVALDPDDEYTLLVTGLAALDGLTEDGGPLPIVIDPASYAVTVPKTMLATKAWGYDNFSYAGSGTLNTCSKVIQMNIAITVAQGSFGSYAFTIKF